MNPRTGRKKTRGQKAANFVVQGSVLAMAGIMVRIIGMFYRIPSNDIIGKQRSGRYTSAFNVYNILLILSPHSMSVAVSKMISARLARGEHKSCSRVLKAALIYTTTVGDIAAVVLWFRTDLFAQLTRTSFSRCALKTLTPTIWIMVYPDAPGGYSQGTGTIVLTAISQILEQIINAVVSTVAVGILPGVGTSINATQGAEDYSHTLGATGGTIDTGVGVLMAFLFFARLTTSKGRERRQMVREDVSGRTGSCRRVFYVLTVTVLPIVISSGIYDYSSVVDNYLFSQNMGKLGYMEDSITTYWGMLRQCQLLFNIPMAVSNAPSSSLIPSLARTAANRNRKEKSERIAASIYSSLLTAIPAAVGITVLTKPVYNLLFISEGNTMLMRFSMVGSLIVVFYPPSTITNVVPRGLNHMGVPIRHAVIALVIHVAVLGVFLMVPKIGIYSVVFINIVSALVTRLLNRHAIARLVRYRQEYKRTLILSIICASLMGAAAYGVYRGIYALLPDQLTRGRMGIATVVFPSVAAAILVHAALLIRFRAVEEEEPKGMPGGKRLVRLLDRFRLLG